MRADCQTNPTNKNAPVLSDAVSNNMLSVDQKMYIKKTILFTI